MDLCLVDFFRRCLLMHFPVSDASSCRSSPVLHTLNAMLRSCAALTVRTCVIRRVTGLALAFLPYMAEHGLLCCGLRGSATRWHLSRIVFNINSLAQVACGLIYAGSLINIDAAF